MVHLTQDRGLFKPARREEVMEAKATAKAAPKGARHAVQQTRDQARSTTLEIPEEDISEEERREIRAILKEMDAGHYVTLEQVRREMRNR